MACRLTSNEYGRPELPACATKRSPPSSVAERSGLIMSASEPNSKTGGRAAVFDTRCRFELALGLV